MDVTDKGQEIGILIAEDGFIAVLEEVPPAAVPAVEILSIPGKELSHNSGDPALSASDKNVDMIVHEDPGEDSTFGSLCVLSKTRKEPEPVFCIAEII